MQCRLISDDFSEREKCWTWNESPSLQSSEGTISVTFYEYFRVIPVFLSCVFFLCIFFCLSQAYGVFVPFVRINIKTNTVKSQTPGCYNPEVSLLSDYVQPVTQTDDISASFCLNTLPKITTATFQRRWQTFLFISPCWRGWCKKIKHQKHWYCPWRHDMPTSLTVTFTCWIACQWSLSSLLFFLKKILFLRLQSFFLNAGVTQNIPK